MSKENKEFLQWIHDRMHFVHGENKNYDYMHKLREVIAAMPDVSPAIANKAAEEGGLPASDFQWRKKPVVIEAIQWPGCRFPETPPQWFIDAMYKTPGKPGFLMRMGDDIFIETLEGRMRAEPGDWIIRGIAGEIYPCKPEIFEASYDRASRQVANKAEVEPVAWACPLTLAGTLMEKPDVEWGPENNWDEKFKPFPLYATPPATTGASTAREAWEYSFTHSSAIGHGNSDIGPCLTYDRTQAFGVGCFGQKRVFVSVGASTVLTDERIDELIIKHRLMHTAWPMQSTLTSFAREVAAQAGQVAMPEVLAKVTAICAELRDFYAERDRHELSAVVCALMDRIGYEFSSPTSESLRSPQEAAGTKTENQQ